MDHKTSFRHVMSTLHMIHLHYEMCNMYINNLCMAIDIIVHLHYYLTYIHAVMLTLVIVGLSVDTDIIPFIADIDFPYM